MRVFLSWSGERSKLVAELLNTWLKCTIQSLQPWISTRGIGRGELWFPAINKELAETSVGIVCLTRDNLNAPWILFESGALAKGLDSNRVITLLIDLEPSDINDPLAQFNHTLPNNMESMNQLLISINQLSSNPLDPEILQKVFNKYYGEFKEGFDKILESTSEGPKPKKQSNEEVLNQILSSVRSFDKRIRFIEAKNDFIREDLNSDNELKKVISVLKNQNEILRRENQNLKINKNNFGLDIGSSEFGGGV